MNNFNKVLSEELDNLEVSGEARSKLDLVHELVKELNDSKNHVANLEIELRNAIEDLNVELAKSLRKKMPQIGINLSDGRCSIFYKSTNLSCKPDITNNMWAFDANPHGRRFMRHHGPVLHLMDDIGPLSDAIISYFKKYKSLNK